MYFGAPTPTPIASGARKPEVSIGACGTGGPAPTRAPRWRQAWRESAALEPRAAGARGRAILDIFDPACGRIHLLAPHSLVACSLPPRLLGSSRGGAKNNTKSNTALQSPSQGRNSRRAALDRGRRGEAGQEATRHWGFQVCRQIRRFSVSRKPSPTSAEAGCERENKKGRCL